MANVVAIGTLDTKGAEYGFLRDRLLEDGVDVILVDAGVLGEPAIARGRGPQGRDRPVSRRSDRRAGRRRLRARADDRGRRVLRASSMERLPTEIAMTETARRFKSLKPSPTA